MSTISAGTTSTTTLIASGDTTGSLVLKTNDTGSGGTTAMTIDTSQNVGIGTTSPNIGGANTENAILTLKGKASTRNGIFEMGNFGTTGNDQTLGWNRYFDGSTENASIEVARASSTSTAYMKFSTNGGSGNTERARIDSSGNLLLNTTTLDGGFTCNKTASFAGNIYPAVDNNGWNCGTAAKRWQTIYAVTGTINTSDARLKTPVCSLADAEITAAQQIADEIGAFKWLDAIELKGEQKARSHIGLTVQRAIEILEQNGLNPFDYGFICFDEWEEQVAEDGTVVQKAGNRYSFRTDELSLFVSRGQQAVIQEQQAIIAQLTERISALENK